MSFKIVDRIRALQDAISRELANPLELEIDSEEYKFKQKMIFRANEELKVLETSMKTLSQEWDVTEDIPLSPVSNYENYRDWEERITNEQKTPTPSPRHSSPDRDETPPARGGGDGSQDEEDAQIMEELSPEERKALEPIKRATRIIKGIEEHKVPYDVLLRRRMKSSERASAKAVDEAIMELFQIPDKITERRIKDFIASNHLETSTLKETLKVYQEVESVRRSVKRFCSMNEALVNVHQGNTAFNFLQSAVNIIAQLKFAFWWNKYDARAASGWKSDHKTAMTDGMGASEAKRVTQQFNKATDCRNITFRLYQKFGAIVVLQPIFHVLPDGRGPVHGNRDVLNTVIRNHREWVENSALLIAIQQANSTFEGTVDELIDDHFQKCHEASVNLILHLFKHGCGAAMEDWAKRFFDKLEEHREVRVGRDEE